MKKLLSLALVAGCAATISACGAIPSCNDELDECTYGGAYTEERTVQTRAQRAAMVAPEPAPVVVQAPAPAPVVQPKVVVAPTPAPMPAPVMQPREPKFTQITK